MNTWSVIFLVNKETNFKKYVKSILDCGYDKRMVEIVFLCPDAHCEVRNKVNKFPQVKLVMSKKPENLALSDALECCVGDMTAVIRGYEFKPGTLFEKGDQCKFGKNLVIFKPDNIGPIPRDCHCWKSNIYMQCAVKGLNPTGFPGKIHKREYFRYLYLVNKESNIHKILWKGVF